MITIVPYDTSWPAAFIAIGRPLRMALGELALRIDHIGSNSVPGLAAKDVIDVQVTLKDFSCTPQLLTAIGSLGYTLVPDITTDHLPPLYHTISQSVVERMVVSLVAHLIDSPCFSTSSDRCCDTSKGMRPLVLRRLIHRALV